MSELQAPPKIKFKIILTQSKIILQTTQEEEIQDLCCAYETNPPLTSLRGIYTHAFNAYRYIPLPAINEVQAFKRIQDGLLKFKTSQRNPGAPFSRNVG